MRDVNTVSLCPIPRTHLVDPIIIVCSSTHTHSTLKSENSLFCLSLSSSSLPHHVSLTGYIDIESFAPEESQRCMNQLGDLASVIADLTSESSVTEVCPPIDADLDNEGFFFV
jgi:hypothetical protein